MKRRIATALGILALGSTLAGTSMAQTNRGNQYDYDAGAPKNSRWPDLFAQTPNYRAFGQAVIGGRGEKFRWKMGPMWYRGRLTPESVKVFIVGQEGAQDENVSNRSFTGSTGTRMQKFLNYMGINQSYLFMNTFVYTIAGQYSLFGEDREDEAKLAELERLLWLAQNEDSIVVKHRHDLFDYMLETNKDTLKVVIGVGAAGKDSVATWFRSHGASCSNSKLSGSTSSAYCKGTGKLNGVIAVGVKHPGAASERNGGASASDGLRKDFQLKADIVRAQARGLTPDPGAKRGSGKFTYGYASIPHRDFPFGTNWRMGEWATTSNRRGSDTIQVFSSEGCYNNAERENGRCPFGTNLKAANLRYDDPSDLLGRAPREMESFDLPFESPKGEKLRREYDYGPGKFVKKMIQFGTLDYNSLGVTQHNSFGPNGIYRGDLENAELLILADQASNTDFFSGRALTGEAGQRLQSFLNASEKSYAILRTLPVDTTDLTTEEAAEVALDSTVQRHRQALVEAILAEGKTRQIITVGPVAAEVVARMSTGLKVINLPMPHGNAADINAYKNALGKLNPGARYNGELSIIPRSDLPAYTRWWMGTSGDLAARAYRQYDKLDVDNISVSLEKHAGETWVNVKGTFVDGTYLVDGENVVLSDDESQVQFLSKVFDGNYYRLYAPKWSSSWRVSEDDLTAEELQSLRAFQRTGL